MPWPRPTLTDLRQIARGFYKARLKGADGALRRNNIAVNADVMAGMANGQYGYLDYLIRQNFTDTAEGYYLLRKGAMFGMAPTGAIAASGPVVVTGDNGTPIPANLTLFQDPDGNTYVTQAAAEVAGGTATVTVEASAGGAAQNLAAGIQMTLTTAIAGLNPTAVVGDGGLTGGADEEDIEAFRTRVLARQAQPPQGGDSFDYIGWAKTVPGVTRAWIYPLARGGGTLNLTFVMDGRDDIVPTADDVATVQAAIDALDARPVTDDCLVFAPAKNVVDFTISGVADAAVRTAIIASVRDMFIADAVPGGAFDPYSGVTFDGGLSFEAQVDPAVAAGAGDVIFDLVTPSADIAGTAGVLAVIGAFTWT